MLKIAARNEVLDREAHLVRVLDRLREQRTSTAAGPSGGGADDGACRGSALDRAVAA